MPTLAIIIAALALDRLLGEPRRYHPLVGFGRLAQGAEALFYGPKQTTTTGHRLQGAAALFLLLLPPALILNGPLLQALDIAFLIEIGVLYLCLGAKSLAQHSRPIQAALQAGDIDDARRQVSGLVSRDTQGLDQQGIARATVESVLENGNDAVFGTLFWFAVAGAPGALIYRLANTLDAMWGYRNERYRDFGWAAARLDDLLNLIPARLTALSYALAGRTGCALRCWRQQARYWESPNAGPVMATGAGALGVTLGGPAPYQGAVKERPPLGEGDAPKAPTIGAALRLVDHSLLLWLIALALIYGGYGLAH